MPTTIYLTFWGVTISIRNLEKRGFTEVQIHHKFLLGADNVNSWEYEFFEGKTVHYKQESRQCLITLKPMKG